MKQRNPGLIERTSTVGDTLIGGYTPRQQITIQQKAGRLERTRNRLNRSIKTEPWLRNGRDQKLNGDILAAYDLTDSVESGTSFVDFSDGKVCG